MGGLIKVLIFRWILKRIVPIVLVLGLIVLLVVAL